VRTRTTLAASMLAVVALITLAVSAGGAEKPHSRGPHTRALDGVKHIVVIYEENHSFDNLYGRWEGVNGLASADRAHATQVTQTGRRYACLLQSDVNLATPPQDGRCSDTNPKTGASFQSHFYNRSSATFGMYPFPINAYIGARDTTCPDPKAPTASPANSGANGGAGVKRGEGLPGGCTRDLVHRYYQEQYQLHSGRQDRYTTGSDAAGLTQGYYQTSTLPVYRYLHARHHPRYAISDAFFQSAFGGSFLNHQWLIAAHTPRFVNASPQMTSDDLHSTTDTNGMPSASYPLYKPTSPTVKDAPLTDYCGGPSASRHDKPRRDVAHGNAVCGDWAVNTIQPRYQPYAPGTADTKRLPPLHDPTIGDRLTSKRVSWAWYSGGWSNADGRQGEPGWTSGSGPTCTDPGTDPKASYPHCPDRLFQYHHQPFNYYANYAPGTTARARHLRDEREFINAAKASRTRCRLKQVSFVKPLGKENEHPGYASETAGDSHLVSLLKSIQRSACAKDTMVVVTYDEFGGQWDHVPPPGQGGMPGPHEAWGPGTRIPALTISPRLRGDFVVDHRQHDTTSILATIEHRFALAPLGSRDAHVSDLASVFAAPSRRRALPPPPPHAPRTRPGRSPGPCPIGPRPSAC